MKTIGVFILGLMVGFSAKTFVGPSRTQPVEEPVVQHHLIITPGTFKKPPKPPKPSKRENDLRV